jgi:hypothetical protein
MDMGMAMGTNVFQTGNMALARDFWYIIAVVMGIIVLIRAVNFYQSQTRFVTVFCPSCR